MALNDIIEDLTSKKRVDVTESLRNPKAFFSSFNKGLSIPSDFSVKIIPPLALNGILPSNKDILSFRCESTTLPGRNISTTDLRIYGPTEKFAYQTTYEDITFTFMCSAEMTEKLFFDAWLNYINPYNKWNFEYKENYVAPSIQIEQYDRVGSLPYKVELIEAFPIAVNQLDVDWSHSDSYHKLSVTFAYTSWKVMPIEDGEVIDVEQMKMGNGYNLGAILQGGVLIYSAGKAIAKGNPYAILGAIGAATSIIPSIGGTKTLSSIINSQGRGALDTQMDAAASSVNLAKQSVPGLTNTTQNLP